MRCICCNNPMPYKSKMRPVTTYSGEMKDKFKDHMEDFPWQSEESLCRDCLEPIKSINSDTNESCVTYGISFYQDDVTEDLAYDLSGNSQLVDKDYQGWGEKLKLYDK